jgi:type IV pilus assembly protein PilB
VNGDSVVLRLLDGALALLSIDQLGLPERDERSIREILGRGHGMLLATGPTGSGKSTTLYAALREIRATGVNIITIENPVEYHIDGITQIQVNVDTGMTFARALRNILRHDPDVIMIGEIRDEESARIAVECAMTGHLVLSTLHTNSAAGSIARLIEMGIPPYLLNSSLSGCLAQRLVRRNCPHCLGEAKVDAQMRSFLGIEEGESFWEGQGCEQCSGNGYRGRVGVYELLVLSDSLRQTLSSEPTAIERVAVEEGMTLLLENAMRQARAGVISLREVFRIRGD